MTHRPSPASPPTQAVLSGAQKTAVLLLSLPEPDAAALLRRIPEEQIDRISTEMSHMADIAPRVRYGVLQEFRELAREAISLSAPTRSFAFLEQVSPAQAVALLEKQPPRTTAVVLSHLRPVLAGELLVRLPRALQMEALTHIAAAGAVSADELERIEAHLLAHMSKGPQPQPE